MLYTKIVGDVGELKTNWYDYEDEYGNRIFTCDSLKQKLRLFNHVSSKLDEIYVNEDSSCYDIDDNVAFTNSNKNFALELFPDLLYGHTSIISFFDISHFTKFDNISCILSEFCRNL